MPAEFVDAASCVANFSSQRPIGSPSVMQVVRIDEVFGATSGSEISTLAANSPNRLNRALLLYVWNRVFDEFECFVVHRLWESDVADAGS